MLQARIHAQLRPGISAKVTAQLGGSVGAGGHYEIYDGPYEAEPDFTGQELATKGKLMRDNVAVQPIAVASVSNNAGGRTIYVGGTSNA